MYRDKLFEPIGYLFAAVTLFFSFWLFYADTETFLGSLFAAAIAAGLAWMTYIGIRLVLFAIRK